MKPDKQPGYWLFRCSDADYFYLGNADQGDFPTEEERKQDRAAWLASDAEIRQIRQAAGLPA